MRYLKQSLEHSLSMIRGLIQKREKDLIAEPLLQLIRDGYYYRFAKRALNRIAEICGEMELFLSDDELGLLVNIELSSRKQKDFYKLSEDLDLNLCENILSKFTDWLSTVPLPQ